MAKFNGPSSVDIRIPAGADYSIDTDEIDVTTFNDTIHKYIAGFKTVTIRYSVPTGQPALMLLNASKDETPIQATDGRGRAISLDSL